MVPVYDDSRKIKICLFSLYHYLSSLLIANFKNHLIINNKQIDIELKDHFW